MSAEIRPHPLLPDKKMAIVDRFEYVFEYPYQGVRSLPAGVLRNVRLDLQVLLQQNNGTFETTNAIAHDIAVTIVRQMRTRGELNEQSE